MGNKEWIIRVPDEEYFNLPLKLREKATVFHNTYQEMKDDEVFMDLYKKYKKAKKELESYKFKKIHEQ